MRGAYPQWRAAFFFAALDEGFAVRHHWRADELPESGLVDPLVIMQVDPTPRVAFQRDMKGFRIVDAGYLAITRCTSLAKANESIRGSHQDEAGCPIAMKQNSCASRRIR